ncbi:hypothetical protein [Chitinophaga sp.]|uniref:hypothetical protein n=1 Tax=Chitinophaga sp. TaxID=1869181 RepID=UPI002F95CA20
MPRYITVTSLLNKTKKRDPWLLDDYTINPYSGCAFNCLYCYIRGSKYGINMADKLSVKENALVILRRQLAARARKQQLARMYTAFKQHGARYTFPASITLWGGDAADSKQLVLQAVQQYYPQHLTNYNGFLRSIPVCRQPTTAHYRLLQP